MEPLKNIGLSSEQITIYQVLLEYGKLPASTIASKSNISRVITYKLLDQLVHLGLAKKLILQSQLPYLAQAIQKI